jgi:hypothetical protein
MDPQDLEVQLNLLFQDDLFGIKKQKPNREVHFAIWSIRWNDVSVLPDMVMIKKLDFERIGTDASKGLEGYTGGSLRVEEKGMNKQDGVTAGEGKTLVHHEDSMEQRGFEERNSAFVDGMES